MEKRREIWSENWRFQDANMGMQLAAGNLLVTTAWQLAEDSQTRSTAGRYVRLVVVVAMAIADEWLILARRIIPVWWRSANIYRAFAHYNGSLQAGSVVLAQANTDVLRNRYTAVTARLQWRLLLCPFAKAPASHRDPSALLVVHQLATTPLASPHMDGHGLPTFFPFAFTSSPTPISLASWRLG